MKSPVYLFGVVNIVDVDPVNGFEVFYVLVQRLHTTTIYYIYIIVLPQENIQHYITLGLR